MKLFGLFRYLLPLLHGLTINFIHIPREKFFRGVFIFWMFFLLYLLARTFIVGEIAGGPYGNEPVFKFNIFQLFKNYNVLLARSFLPPMKSTVLLFSSYIALILTLVTVLIKLHKKASLSVAAYLAAISLLLSLLPVISLGVDSHDTESERFLYLSSVFVVLLIVELMYAVIKRKTILHLLMGCLLVVEIVMLANAAQTYRKSSVIAAASINAAGRSRIDQVLYCIDLPTQYKGAFIFRIGFPEAIKWLTPDSASKKAVVLSQREIVTPVLPYRFEEMSLDSLDDTLNRGCEKSYSTVILIVRDQKVLFRERIFYCIGPIPPLLKSVAEIHLASTLSLYKDVPRNIYFPMTSNSRFILSPTFNPEILV